MTQDDRMILVDGIARHRYNALNKLIDPSDEGLINFWRWFNNSQAVDAEGKPWVVYHGTNAMAYSGGQRIEVFHTHSRGGAFFSSSKEIASEYGESVYAAYLKIEDIVKLDAQGASWSNISTQVSITANPTGAVLNAKNRARQETDALYAALFEETTPENNAYASNISLRLLRDMPGLESETVETDIIARAAKILGYDGVIINNVIDSPTSDKLYSRTPSTIFVANRAENIKSIDSYGHWAPDDTQFFAPEEKGAQHNDANDASPNF